MATARPNPGPRDIEEKKEKCKGNKLTERLTRRMRGVKEENRGEEMGDDGGSSTTSEGKEAAAWLVLVGKRCHNVTCHFVPFCPRLFFHSH